MAALTRQGEGCYLVASRFPYRCCQGVNVRPGVAPKLRGGELVSHRRVTSTYESHPL